MVHKCRIDGRASILQHRPHGIVGRELDINEKTRLHRRQSLPFLSLPFGDLLLNHLRVLDAVGMSDGRRVAGGSPAPVTWSAGLLSPTGRIG